MVQPLARQVAYVPGTPVFTLPSGRRIGITCEQADFVYVEEFTICEFQPDGRAMASMSQSISGDWDKWSVLKTIMEYCGIVVDTPDAAQAWLASMDIEAAMVKLSKWWNEKAIPMINAELKTEYEANQMATPPATGTPAADVIALINRFLFKSHIEFDAVAKAPVLKTTL